MGPLKPTAPMMGPPKAHGPPKVHGPRGRCPPLPSPLGGREFEYGLIKIRMKKHVLFHGEAET